MEIMTKFKSKLKIFTLIMCLAVFALMALGSGSSDSSDDDTKKVVTDDTDSSDSSKDSDTENGDSESTNDTDSNDDTSSDSSDEKTEVSIDEQVLIDQDDIVITATEYVTDEIWGDGIKLLIENNTDKDVTIGCTALIVNDYMISDLFAENVAAGKKSNTTLYLESYELEEAGIDTVGQIEIYFHAYDEDTWDKIFDSDCVTIQTSEYANMDTTPNDEGAVLYDEGGIKIVGKTVDEDSFWGTAILLYMENSTGKNITISCDDMSINGFMTEPYFSCEVYDGKKAFDDITVLSSDLEDNGIESIDEVELQFHIYDSETYDTIVDTDPISFKAE
jgi:hypothetical protein